MRGVLLYLTFVGLPVLGLIALLQFGRQAEAPPALSGQWRVERGAACGLRTGDAFEVVQSGLFLSVRLPRRPAMEGRLRPVEGGQGRVLRARGGERGEAMPGCAGGPLELALRVPDGIPTRIGGTVGVPGCTGCPPQPIAVARVDAAADGRGGR